MITPRIDIWYPRPLSYDDSDPFRGRIVIARLKDGVTLETVRAAMTALATRLVAEHPSSYTTGPLRLSVSTLDQEVVSEVKPALAALSGAVGFVLLVACANLANLLLARASARSREVAVRVSIGASRGQIAGQLGAEGMLLGCSARVGGLLIATWCVDGAAPAGAGDAAAARSHRRRRGRGRCSRSARRCLCARREPGAGLAGHAHQCGRPR